MTKFLLLFSIVLALGIEGCVKAARTHDIYMEWKRPDSPSISCCNNTDCYATEARFSKGQWLAKRREDGVWVVIPATKILKAGSPDGRAHLCATERVIYCFARPEGDS